MARPSSHVEGPLLRATVGCPVSIGSVLSDLTLSLESSLMGQIYRVLLLFPLVVALALAKERSLGEGNAFWGRVLGFDGIGQEDRVLPNPFVQPVDRFAGSGLAGGVVEEAGSYFVELM